MNIFPSTLWICRSCSLVVAPTGGFRINALDESAECHSLLISSLTSLQAISRLTTVSPIVSFPQVRSRAQTPVHTVFCTLTSVSHWSFSPSNPQTFKYVHSSSVACWSRPCRRHCVQTRGKAHDPSKPVTLKVPPKILILGESNGTRTSQAPSIRALTPVHVLGQIHAIPSSPKSTKITKKKPNTKRRSHCEF
jgi:hypothetical protein